MRLPTVDRTDESYRVTVDDREVIVPGEWTEQSADSIYAPWEDAIGALFRASTEVIAEDDAFRVLVDSPERALVDHDISDDETEAIARLAVLDHKDIVAFDGSGTWTVPAPAADSEIRVFGYATVTELAADILRSALESVEMQGKELVESEGDETELQLYEVIEEIDVLTDTLDHYHEEIRTSIALNRWDDIITDPIDGLTGVLVSAFRLNRSVEAETPDEVVESHNQIADELGDITRRTQSLSEIDHEAFISELNALADVSAEPLDVEANDGSPAEVPEATDGSSDDE